MHCWRIQGLFWTKSNFPVFRTGNKGIFRFSGQAGICEVKPMQGIYNVFRCRILKSTDRICGSNNVCRRVQGCKEFVHRRGGPQHSQKRRVDLTGEANECRTFSVYRKKPFLKGAASPSLYACLRCAWRWHFQGFFSPLRQAALSGTAARALRPTRGTPYK